MNPRTDPTTTGKDYCRAHGYHGFSECPKCTEAEERLTMTTDGPYCPNCGTFLGSGYAEGDICLECWEIADARIETPQCGTYRRNCQCRHCVGERRRYH